jgi:hypothetical protein
MPDLFDFEVTLTPSSQGAEPAQVVVFFTGPEMIDDAQITEALQHRLDEYILPDHVIFLVPLCYREEIRIQCASKNSPIATALDRGSQHSTPSYGFSFFDQYGSITKYVRVAGQARNIAHLVTTGVEEIIKAGMCKLVKCTPVLNKAPAGFLFSKPSSRASNYFIRAESLLSETLHAHFLGFVSLKMLKPSPSNGLGEPDTIYLDTMSFLPIGLSVQLFQTKFGVGGITRIKSFHSHNGLKDGPMANGANALCLISASTNCGLAQEWVRVNGAPKERVATFLSFLENSDACTVLHTLNKPDDFETLSGSESTGAHRMIRIHGERFVAEQIETRLLNISMAHLPEGLQGKFYSFMGAGLFTCFSQIPKRERHRTVHVNKTKLVETDGFQKWFNQCLAEESPASTTRIIHEDDAASDRLATKALAYLHAQGLNDCKKINERLFKAEDKFEGSVIIVAAAAERGSVLQSISRRLRTAQAQGSGTRLYMVGALFGRSYEQMAELDSNLCQPPKGHRRYVFKKYLEIPAASLSCNSHWAQEYRLLNKLVAFSDPLTSSFIHNRADGFERAATLGLSDNVFWESSYTKKQMVLSKGFAFVDGSKPVETASCVDVFLTIHWILQNARDNAKIKDAKRLESGELQQVLLTPEIFSRYDDGIIQGAFLRAALPTELDYSAHETFSTSMADIILRVVQGYGHERGEAAMEFVIALAINKIRLHKEVDSKLRLALKHALASHVQDIDLFLDPEPTPI